MGPHVFGDGRLGLWVTASENFADKLRHRLPRIKAYGVTDIFLPREATLADKALVRSCELFVALYESPPGGDSATSYAQRAIADIDRLAVGVAELNIEGLPDVELAAFVRSTVTTIRAVKKSLRLRINVVPFKGGYLPMELFASDPQLHLIVQNYYGNMDGRVSEAELLLDLEERGCPRDKVSIMYGAHIGQPRVPALPALRRRGSIYQDDLMADAGYIS